MDWNIIKNGNPPKQGRYIVTYLSRKGERKVEERWFFGGNYSGRNGDEGWNKGKGTIIAWAPMPEPHRGK